VHQVLTNEKYMGNNVYNRTSFKLKAKHISNPPEMWVRANGAFSPIVGAETFLAVQRVIWERSQRLSDGDMLDRLATLLREHGWLSGLIIDEHDDMPSTSCYRSRFGSLLRAYERVGYTPARDYRYLEINRTLRRLYPDIVAKTVAAIQRVGGTTSRDPATDLLTVNDEFRTSIVVSRCRQTSRGSYRWTIRFEASLRPDITVAVRMTHGNDDVLDYYLLPRIDVEAPTLLLGEENGTRLDAYRTDSLESFFYLAARSPIGAVA
jgi:hypothetical protein